MDVLVQSDSLGAAQDLERAISLLKDVSAGLRADTLRIYIPQATMAFGQRDARAVGFDSAVATARVHGFEPLVRKAGGRAMPYHHGCLVVDHIQAEKNAVLSSRERFAAFGEYFATLFQGFSIDARVGEIAGEYCPGEFSVHANVGAEWQVKLVGTAQRVVNGAYLFSSALVISDPEPLREVLTPIYADLDLPLRPSTIGAASDANSAITVDSVINAILETYPGRTHHS